ncbi:MAG: glycine cleavage system protein T [Gammaproteobacteria bacterium]|nr:glycine cleavage system protein T [Gammaproteobacteria bacterium]
MHPSLYLTARIRKSPFFDATSQAGATQFSVYNRTYMPGGYASMEEEYWSLVNDVVLWDVTCQRVIEVSGADAKRFSDYLTTRDLSSLQVGAARYVLLTNQHGGVLNDPVLMRMDHDKYWFSCADGDVGMWMHGVLVGSDFDVRVAFPDVATLQLQGPKSLPLLRDLLGDRITKLAYYRHVRCELHGIPLIIARTGWSAERGYELYLLDLARGGELWRILMEEGRRYAIAPGSPSRVRRIEAGILDYGVDMDVTTNPYELGLQRLVDLDSVSDFVGKAALRAIHARGVSRQVVGLHVEGDPVTPNEVPYIVRLRGNQVGKMTSWVFSPRSQRNLALAMLDTQVASPASLSVDYPQGERAATVVALPFVDPEKRLARA